MKENQIEPDSAEEKSRSILDSVKQAAASVSEKISDIKDDIIGDEQKTIMEEFKETSIGKVKLVMEEISNSIDLITKSGYEFKSMNVSVGLPPSISASFHYRKDISENERIALIEEAKEKKFVSMLLKCLFKAGSFYRSIKIGDYVLEGVCVTLGLTPGVSMDFKKKSN